MFSTNWMVDGCYMQPNPIVAWKTDLLMHGGQLIFYTVEVMEAGVGL